MASWEKSHEIPNINGALWSFMKLYSWENHSKSSRNCRCSIAMPGFPGQQQQGNSRATTILPQPPQQPQNPNNKELNTRTKNKVQRNQGK